MSTPTGEQLSSMPSALGLYARAAGSARRKPKGKPQIPLLAASMPAMKVDAAHLAAYRAICGFADGDTLPILYPQIMAQPLAMHLMTQPSFPLPLLGLVHLRNHIEQLRPLRADEQFDVRVATAESREVKQGLEFDLAMDYTVGSEVIWRATMTVLHRVPGPKDRRGGKSAPPAPATELAEYRSFEAPADIGRRYAKVSGDYNPIHLYAATAKLFGFPRAIAHGLWSVARCCALLQAELGHEPKSLSVQFKQPLLLPGKVALKFLRRDDGLHYSLLARGSDKVHLGGILR